jgi:hypothetical protein
MSSGGGSMRRGEILNHDDFKIQARGHKERMERIARLNSGRPPKRVGQRRPTGGQSRYTRSVVVKVMYRDRATAGGRMVADLANYLEKEGPMFDRAGETTAQNVIQEWGEDRRVFHVIVSPEDGNKLTHEPMQDYARDVVSRWEERTGHKLQWVASVEEKADAAHPDGNKHLHIMIRGEQDGRLLFFEKEIITDGFRHDAKEAMTDRLGYMTHTQYQEMQQRKEILEQERRLEQERFQEQRQQPKQGQRHEPEYEP